MAECRPAAAAPARDTPATRGGVDGQLTRDQAPHDPAREPPAGAACWHLYVLRRADGALYTGISTDVERRIAEHTRGGARAARSLRARGPLTLVYRALLGAHGTALRAERRIKALPRRDKEALLRLQPDPGALLNHLGL